MKNLPLLLVIAAAPLYSADVRMTEREQAQRSFLADLNRLEQGDIGAAKDLSQLVLQLNNEKEEPSSAIKRIASLYHLLPSEMHHMLQGWGSDQSLSFPVLQQHVDAYSKDLWDGGFGNFQSLGEHREEGAQRALNNAKLVYAAYELRPIALKGQWEDKLKSIITTLEALKEYKMPTEHASRLSQFCDIELVVQKD